MFALMLASVLSLDRPLERSWLVVNLKVGE